MELNFYTFTAKKNGTIFGVLKSNTDNVGAGEGEVIRRTFHKDEPNVEAAYEAYWDYRLVVEEEKYKIIVKEEHKTNI